MWLLEEGEPLLQDGDDQAAALAAAPKKPKVEVDTKYLPSALDPATQRLISLIFNEDMFNEAMQVTSHSLRTRSSIAISYAQYA